VSDDEFRLTVDIRGKDVAVCNAKRHDVQAQLYVWEGQLVVSIDADIANGMCEMVVPPEVLRKLLEGVRDG